MGILLNGLGNLSGKVGDIVFRQRNGKTYVAKAPKRRSKYVSPETLDRRNKFSAVTILSKTINSVPQLKEIWAYCCKKKYSPYNRIIKTIYANIDKDNFTKFGGIIPDHGCNFIKCSFVQSLKKVIINIIEPAFDGEVYTEQEVNLMIAGIVVLSEPNREGDKPMHVIGIKSGIHELSMEFPQKIEHAFWGVELSIIESYNKRDFYLHLITLDADGKVVRYSDKIEQSTN